EVVLGRPHRVVAERVARLCLADQVVVGAAIALLAVVPRVRRRPVDAGVGHVHGAIEERAEMHSTLPCRREVSARRVCTSTLARPSSGDTPGWRIIATRRAGREGLRESGGVTATTPHACAAPRRLGSIWARGGPPPARRERVGVTTPDSLSPSRPRGVASGSHRAAEAGVVVVG